MSTLKYVFVTVIGTLLRFFPLPTKTALIKIGNPDEGSPVFLTCNYSLTVERVKKALKGIDCYLLVANSRGINVWCASAGGHFSNYDIISALKTTGIEKLVNHRDVVLPQLAATGIDAKVIKEKIGWNVIWGPVYAENIKSFLKNKFIKPEKMRKVKFSLTQRFEMAIMWGFPFSLIVVILALLFWKKMVVPWFVLSWFLPFLIFLPFPLYSPLLKPKRNKSKIPYNLIFEIFVIPLVTGLVIALAIFVYEYSRGAFTWKLILEWAISAFVIAFLICFDLLGSTPIYKSGFLEEENLTVAIYEEKCIGCGWCVNVCPKNCFEMSKKKNIAVISRINNCIQCGACIVQCPVDALFFKSPKNKMIGPETIRKYKLNMMGKRLKEIKTS